MRIFQKNKSAERGFTLIETLLYLALFSIIVGSALVIAYEIIESNARQQLRVDVAEEGGFLSQKINWAMSGASWMSVGSTTLSILRPDGSASFSFSNGNLVMNRGNGTTTLNASAVAVADLSFTDIPASQGKPEGVETRMTLRSQTYSQSFDFTNYVQR